MTIYCQNGCGRPAIHVTKKGKHQCAAHHRKCPSVLSKGYETNKQRYGSKMPAGNKEVMNKMKETSAKKYGVENASSLEWVKTKRKTTLLTKYGVENPSFIPEVVAMIRDKANKRWEDIREGKQITNEGLTRAQYRHRCQNALETTYRKYKHLIDPENKRGSKWHIDHVFSVEDGFMNDVPYHVLSHISNLQLISNIENYQKHKKSEKTLAQLYEDYHRHQSS